LEPLSIDDFIQEIKATSARGGKPQLLLFSAEHGTKQATRNVASNHAAMCLVELPSTTNFPTPLSGTEDYITVESGHLTGQGGKPHSENKGMRNDWYGFYRAMNLLLDEPTTRRILTHAYGQDFRLLPERGYYRSAPLENDLESTPEELIVHKDYPKWIRSKTEKVKVVTATCQAGQVAWVLLDQAEFHGIPAGGSCVGWFVSAVSPSSFEAYLEKVEQHLRRLRLGQLKSVNHDPQGHQPGYSALDAILLDFCKGSRPHLYESGKTIQAPHSMAANKFPVRQHRYLSPCAFTNIRGTPPLSDSTQEIMKRLETRGLDHVFRKVATDGPRNVDPSSFSDDALFRFFGIQPHFTGKA
jgi:hypothetical protein